MTAHKRNTAFFIFDDVEVLDFTGPYEIFSRANELNDNSLFNIYTVALSKIPVLTKYELSINPDYDLTASPKPDLLIIPGGFGTRNLLHNALALNWINESAKNAEKVISVCTGALLLAKTGLLDGLKATTYHTAFDELAKLLPNTEIMKNTRFVDNGKILTSAGVSAGIDVSLYVIKQLFGKIQAQKTADSIEYECKYL